MDLSWIVHDRAHQVIDRMLRLRHEGLVVCIEQADALMPFPVYWLQPKDRLIYTGKNRRRDGTAKVQQFSYHATAEQHITIHTGHTFEVEFRRGQNERQRQTIINVGANIGIEKKTDHISHRIISLDTSHATL
jgi:hypothetical protein